MMFMGLLTSVFSVGRLLSSVYLGWLCDRCSFKTVYLLSTIICLVGNILYIVPSANIAGSKHILAVSRFLVGFGAGNRSVCRANVAAVTTVKQRLKYITILSAVVFLGYALTPGLGSLTSDADFHILGAHINHFTAPGLILIAINCITLLGLLLVFDETSGKGDAPSDSPSLSTTVDTDPEDESVVPMSLVKLGLWIFIWLNFTARGVLSVFETINVPLFFEATGEDPTSREAVLHSSNYQFCLGIAGLLTYACITTCRKHVSDVLWLVIGFSCMGLGNIILSILPSEISYFRLTFSEILVWSIGCPITAAVIVAAFSKIIGGKPQGMYMGILGAAGSISRVVLPMLPSVLPSFTVVFVVDAVLSIGCVFAVLLYSRCVADAKRQSKLVCTSGGGSEGCPLLKI